MLQYQRQGKSDEAAQVAMQVLRSSARAGQLLTARVAADSEAARTAAMGVLASSGGITQLIKRAEDELKKYTQFRADPSNPGRLLYGRSPKRQSQGASWPNSLNFVQTTLACGFRSPTSSRGAARPTSPSAITR